MPRETPRTAGTIMRPNRRVNHTTMEMLSHLHSRFSAGNVNQIMPFNSRGGNNPPSLRPVSGVCLFEVSGADPVKYIRNNSLSVSDKQLKISGLVMKDTNFKIPLITFKYYML